MGNATLTDVDLATLDMETLHELARGVNYELTQRRGQAILAKSKAALAEAYPDMQAVKVAFPTEEWENGYWYDTWATITFEDGSTESRFFNGEVDNLADLKDELTQLSDLHGGLGRTSTLTIDLVTAIVAAD